MQPGQFDNVIRALVGSFYNAAANDRELQGAIKIQVLREIVDSIGALAAG